MSRRRRRAASALCAALWVVAAVSCSVEESLVPATASVRLSVVDEDLNFQNDAPTINNQVARLVLDEATLTVTDVAEPFSHSFLGNVPCDYVDNVLFGSARPVEIERQCNGSGIALDSEVASTLAFRFRVSRIEIRRAGRPELPDTGDHDGDGVPNGEDNCKIIANPPDETTGLQPDVNGDGVGDACSTPVDEPVLPDQDTDAVADVVDNCLLVYNPIDPATNLQPDGDLDGIGDACAEVASVSLPGGAIELECPLADPFQPTNATVSEFRLGLNSSTSLTCDAAFNTCTVDPSAISFGLAGETDPAPCTVVGP